MAAQANILVVDDDPLARKHLETVLTPEGYRVVTVSSGEEALACIADEAFDVALVDLRLDGMGGMELLAALRERTPTTSVVVITAHPSLETVFTALRQGAHDYLFKPCRIGDVRESVRQALAKRQGALAQRKAGEAGGGEQNEER